MIKRLPKLPDAKRLSGPDAASILDLIWWQTNEDVEAEDVRLPEEIIDWAGLEDAAE